MFTGFFSVMRQLTAQKYRIEVLEMQSKGTAILLEGQFGLIEKLNEKIAELEASVEAIKATHSEDTKMWRDYYSDTKAQSR